MDKRISATRAVRDFSEVLNTIKFKGARYLIERGGKPVACMTPVEETRPSRRLGDLKSILKMLPALCEELDAFAADLEEIRNDQPLMTVGDAWE